LPPLTGPLLTGGYCGPLVCGGISPTPVSTGRRGVQAAMAVTATPTAARRTRVEGFIIEVVS
jgi:hypothetical protein